MSRFNALLLFLVIACALSVVRSTYQQRRLFIDLGRSQADERELQQDWAQLQYQQSALSKTSRIETVAAEHRMQPVLSGRTQYLVMDDAASHATAVFPAVSAPASAAASTVAGAKR